MSRNDCGTSWPRYIGMVVLLINRGRADEYGPADHRAIAVVQPVVLVHGVAALRADVTTVRHGGSTSSARTGRAVLRPAPWRRFRRSPSASPVAATTAPRAPGRGRGRSPG